jgi:prepilin-type N-terminal cleavage/methylation domain-containing protein
MEQLIRSRRNGTRQGFTLIETIIAMAILGGGLLAVAAMQIQAMQFGSRGRHQTQAANIAQSRVELLQGRPWADLTADTGAGWQGPVTVNHVVNDGDNRVEQAYALSYRIENLVAGLTRTIDVRVNWNELKQPGREYAISGVRFNF